MGSNKSMNGILACVALVLAVGLRFSGSVDEKRKPFWDVSASALMGFALLLSAVGIMFYKDHPSPVLVVWGATAAIVVGSLGMFLESQATQIAGRMIGVAMATVLVAALSMRAGLMVPTLLLGACVGAGIFSARTALRGLSADYFGAGIFGLMTFALAAAKFMGDARHSPNAELTGAAMGVGIALAGLIAILALGKKQNIGFMVAVVAAIISVIGWLIVTKWLEIPTAALAALSGAVVAALCAWVLPSSDDKPNSLTFGIVSMLGIGLVTLAFSLAFGYGLAIAVAAMVGVLIFAGSGTGLLAMGPVVGVLALRVVRELYPGTSRAFDIGQHYAVLGLLVGVVLLLGASEWIRSQNTRDKNIVWASGAAGILVLLISVVGMVLLGAKGALGLVLGLGLAAWVAGFRGDRSPILVSSATGLMALLIAAQKPLEPYLNVARDTKLQIIAWLAAACVILVIVVIGLTRSSDKSTS